MKKTMSLTTRHELYDATYSSTFSLMMAALRTLRSRSIHGAKAAFPELRLARLLGPAAGIKTQTALSERLLLYQEACHCIQTGRFVEIGSYLGATAAVLGEALRRKARGSERRLYCIDTWVNHAMSEGKWDTRAVFEENNRPWAQLITANGGHSEQREVRSDGE